jgi:Mrp family chromosome partitioning ATPase
MREQFDVIVIDTPPVLVAGDALKLASAADAGVFVIEAGRTDVRQATWAKRLLQSVNAKMAGALLNRAASASQEYYPYYYTPRRTAHTAK